MLFCFQIKKNHADTMIEIENIWRKYCFFSRYILYYMNQGVENQMQSS